MILDEVVDNINLLYEQSNCEREFKDILIFFNEDIGRCFQLIYRKRESEIEEILPSIFKWFCALYAKYRNDKIPISDILWNKFPSICPYCKKQTCGCNIAKGHLDIYNLKKVASEGKDRKPKTINEWQEHFQKIYPRKDDNSSLDKNVSRLAEELSELSEAYRKSFIKHDIPCVEMELADVFSWIMGIANAINQLKKSKPRHERGKYSIEDVIFQKFHEGCPYCKEFRTVHNPTTVCHCSIKEQKFRLISDYDDLEDLEDSNIRKSKAETPPPLNA